MKLAIRLIILLFIVFSIMYYLFIDLSIFLKFLTLRLSSQYKTANIQNIISSSEHKSEPISSHLTGSPLNTNTEIIICVVACGDRFEETLVMLKSALMFVHAPVKFIIFADDKLQMDFQEKLQDWNSITDIKFKYEVLPIQYPNVTNKAEWKKLFRPCASQRLFFPDILTNIDAILYVDSDTLFLSSVDDLWHHFYKMNSTQLAALAPENEDRANGWYNRFARHPFYGQLGVNSGVMLMNLTRMRAFGWGSYIIPIYREYKLKLTWGDQDILNILFYYHPDKLYIYPCRYNYRADHCMYMSICESAENQGVAVLHGSRGYFHSEKQPAFRACYKAMEQFQLGENAYYNFLLPMKSYLDQTEHTNCGKVKRIFYKATEKYIIKVV